MRRLLTPPFGAGVLRGGRLWATPAASGRLLDTLPVQPIAAFSERLINSERAGGNSSRTRRSSDNAVLDTGFVNGTRDTASISAFVGAGIGAVVTQYGQNKGTRIDLTNAIAAEQPFNVIGGAPVVQNGRPGILCANLGADVGLLAADVLGGTTSELMLQVVCTPLAGSNWYQIGFGNSIGAFFPFSSGGAYYWDVGNNAVPNRVNTGNLASFGAPDVLTFINSVSQSKQELWLNGVLVASDATGHNIVPTMLKAYVGGNDVIHEFLVFNTAAAYPLRDFITRNEGAYIGRVIP
jgi:hypothetical protein